MKNGLFDLSFLESANVDDVMKLNLFGEGVGVSETPSGKPYDAASVSIPKGTAISAETYNSALASLKRSFKEGYEVLEMLEGVEVVAEGADQHSFTENAMYEAMVASYYDGPIYEAVQKEAKAEIKTIAYNVRKKLCKFTRKIKSIFKKISSGDESYIMYDNLVLTKLSDELDTFSWQSVCLLNATRHKTPNDVVAGLEEEFADILGNYGLKIFKIKIINKVTTGTTWGTDGSMDSSMKTEAIPKDVEEMGEEEGNKTKGFFKNLFNSDLYLLIVDEKGSKGPKEIKVTITDSDLASLKKKM